MKKIFLAIAMIPLFLAPALLAQGKTITPFGPGADKIKITGGTIYYAASPYLSIYVNLTRRGAPVLNAKVRLNKTLLREGSGGFYSGAFFTPYNIAIGHEHVFTIEPPLLSPAPPLGTFPPDRAELATYRVDKLIQWVSPTPGQVIHLSAHTLSIRLRWKFTGTPVRVRIAVSDSATRAEVFSGMTAAEEIALPAGVLQPGKTYSVQIDTTPPGCGPMGRFTLAKLASLDSDVCFDWEYNFRFSTAPGPVIF
jgi:hypothetical protein